jgi:hypothetical protein
MPTRRVDENTFPELARLLNVWREHGLVVTSRTALTHWARQTAARTARLPQPELALPLLTGLGLAEPSSDDSLTPGGVLADDPGGHSLDRFGPTLGRRVFERLLLLKEFSDPLHLALSYVRLGSDGLTVSWAAIPRNDQGSPGWLWLQQLELMTHTGSDVTFDPVLGPFVLDTPPARRRVSQAELDERLRLQQERAALAEEYVLRLERERLRAAGMGELADEVVRVSTDDVMAGFDIRSFEVMTGAPRHIEVKSSAGPRLFFVLTRNEYDTACGRQDSYWIAWVGSASNLPGGLCEVAWFQNPAALLDCEHPAWSVSNGDLVVQRSGDDSSYQQNP